MVERGRIYLASNVGGFLESVCFFCCCAAQAAILGGTLSEIDYSLTSYIIGNFDIAIVADTHHIIVHVPS